MDGVVRDRAPAAAAQHSVFERFSPERYDVSKRRELAQLICTVFDHWAIDIATQVALLGLSPKSLDAVRRYRNGGAVALRRDRLERIGHLLAIHRKLRQLFPNDELCSGWISARNRKLGGRRPIDVMLGDGFMGIVNVRLFVEGLANR